MREGRDWTASALLFVVFIMSLIIFASGVRYAEMQEKVVRAETFERCLEKSDKDVCKMIVDGVNQ